MPSVLIVYAHMEKTSFNAALMETSRDTLTSLGHKVTVSDLYEMGFDPVLSRKDMTGKHMAYKMWYLVTINFS